MGNVKVTFAGPMQFLEDGDGKIHPQGATVTLDEEDMRRRAQYGGVIFTKGEDDAPVPESASEPTPGVGVSAVIPPQPQPQPQPTMESRTGKK